MAVALPRIQFAADASPTDKANAGDPVESGLSPGTDSTKPPLEPPDSLADTHGTSATAPRKRSTSPRDPTADPADSTSEIKSPPSRRLPEVGSGDFIIANGSTDVTGSGVLTTYQIEVEREVPLDRDEVAATVDRTLRDPRGWTTSGSHALARVDAQGDIRVLLATPESTDALCAPLDTGGRLSCRNGDLVVLNAWRWLNGASSYAGDLLNYRRYLINHEVGHALGNAHEDCPEPGAKAPVMMQQTKGVEECAANPWPTPRS